MAGDIPLGGGAPESGAASPNDLALAAAGLTHLNLLRATRALFHEWLVWWFDGTLKRLAGLDELFTHCDIRWDQDAIANQPLARPEIRVRFEPQRVRQYHTEDVHTIYVECAAALDFIIRVQAVDDAKSNWLANTVADQLFAIVSHSDARAPLAIRGLQELRPGTPYSIAAAEYKMRGLRCQFKARYTMEREV